MNQSALTILHTCVQTYIESLAMQAENQQAVMTGLDRLPNSYSDFMSLGQRLRSVFLEFASYV